MNPSLQTSALLYGVGDSQSVPANSATVIHFDVIGTGHDLVADDRPRRSGSLRPLGGVRAHPLS